MDEVTGRQERGSCSSGGEKERDVIHGHDNGFCWVSG
jgi:hypothetical protein